MRFSAFEGICILRFSRGDGENISATNTYASRKLQTRKSYWTALNHYKSRHRLARVSWVTWIITIGTIAMWCFTAYQVALLSGARSLHDIIGNVLVNAINIQNNDALTTVVTTYGAKDNGLILAGQYWRFVTPIFLHANLLHVALNMLNFFILGVFLERLLGHLRFLFIYLMTGIISIIASFAFAPQEVSVGASGAIFGLVGAYSIFVLVHRRALARSGIPALIWLVCIIGANLAVGLLVPNVDNYAHLGGLLSGSLLGWWFTPRYVPTVGDEQVPWIDVHTFSRRWFLALLTIVGTILLAISALHFTGG